MNSILRSLYCLPCIWSALCLVIILLAVSYVRKSWLPLYGPTPNEGEIEGFTSVEARTDFYKHKAEALRVRTATIVVLVGIVVWFLGVFIVYLIIR